MSRESHRAPALRELLSTVMQRLDSDRNLKAYQVWIFWDEVVGEAIARRAQPSQFRNDILIVNVASHAWLQELQFMKDDLRRRLNERLGEPILHDIYFVSGNVETPPAKPSTSHHVELVDTAEIVVAPLPEIADPELAQAFARLARARMRRLRTTPDGARRKRRGD